MRIPRWPAAYWITVLLAGFSGSDRASAQDVRAEAVQQRIAALEIKPGKAVGPRVLPRSATALERFLSARPQYFVLPAQAAPPWSASTFRHEWTTQSPPAVRVVEADLLNLPAPALFQASLYLSATAEMNTRLGAQPGPYLNALSTLYALQIPYATNQAWSLNPLDETATFYVLEALDKTPFDFKLLGTGASPAVNVPGITAFLDARLQRLYAGDSDLPTLVAAQRARLMDATSVAPPAADVGADPSKLYPLESALGAYRLEELLAPLVAAGDGGMSDAFRTRLLAIRDELVKNPLAYPHLPSRLRAISALQNFTATSALFEFAKRPEALAAANEKSTVVAEAEAIRHTAFEAFEAEVKLRGGSKFVLPTADTVGWDPYAVTELTSLAIETSSPWAKQVRVYVDDLESNASAADIVKHCELAWREDKLLTEIGTRYGKPDFEVLDFPDTKSERGLICTWNLKVRNEGNVVARVKLFSTTALGQGGAGGGGDPSPPGIAVNQSLPVRAGNFEVVATPTLIEKLKPGDYVESFTGLTSGSAPPTPGRIWVETLKNDEFQVNRSVEIRWGPEADARLRGTTSQEVWARRKENGRPWGWYSLSRLRAGDFIWHTAHGELPITAIGLSKTEVNCRRLLVGGAEPNTHVHQVIVHCDNEMRLDKALHGILADTKVGDTEVTIYDPTSTAIPPLEVGRPISTLAASLEESKLVRLPGFNTDTDAVLRRADLLINNSDDKTQVVYWVVFKTSDGAIGKVGTARSHGYLVLRGTGRAIVPAHEIVAGDRLADGENGHVVVTHIAIEQFDAPVCLKHPRLLRGEWFQSRVAGKVGPLLHTDVRPLDRLGVLAESKIALSFSNASTAEEWNVDPAQTVPIKNLAVFDPQAANSGNFHLMLACNPGGTSAPSRIGAFMPRTAHRVYRDVVADVIEVRVDGGRVLRCAPKTRLWRQASEAGGDKTAFATTEAKELKPGNRILMLRPDAGPADLRIETVMSVKFLDAFQEHPARPYFELRYLMFSESPVAAIAELQRRYRSFFAEGFLIGPAEKAEQRDLFEKQNGGGGGEGGEGPGGTGNGTDGGGPGQTDLDRSGDVVGRKIEPLELAQNPIHEPSITGRLEPLSGLPPLKYSDHDREYFRRSLARLQAAQAAFRAKPPPLKIRSSPAEAQRFSKFREVCELSKNDDLIFSNEAIAAVVSRYLEWRSLLIGSGHPAALAGIAEEGVKGAYLLSVAGGPAKELLDDVVMLHMRSVLSRDRSWWTAPTQTRALMAFALEFQAFDELTKDPEKPSLERFRAVRISCGEWRDLVDQLIAESAINKDVRFQETSSTAPYVLGWNLLLQLDQRAGRPVPLHHGFVTDGMKRGTEFAPSTDFYRHFIKHQVGN
jgi:hypothetical protein